MPFKSYYTRVLELGSAILFVLLVIFVLVALYSMLTPPPLKLNKPIVVVGGPFVSGGTLPFHVDYCKTNENEIAASVHYNFISDVLYPVPLTSVTRLPPGCHVVEFRIPIPTLTSGTYQLQMVYIYRGFGKDRMVQSTTEPFTILPKESR